MTLILERHTLGPVPGRERREDDGARANKSGPIVNVALINNMPDKALAPTERQFRQLLKSASGDRIVRMHCFSLPAIRRSPEMRESIDLLYRQIADLDACAIDGLIVTGTEPLAPSLRDEPYWSALSDLADWARDNTVSTIWSCLAAHAAVLHLDGIERRRLPAKCSGVFSVTPRKDHWMVKGMGERFVVPHSRLNALDPSELDARGYDILTASEEAGVDIFTRRVGGSDFVFFQGHPEYSASALKHEFTRDLRRYLVGESAQAPNPPLHYFGAETERRLGAFALTMADERGPDRGARRMDALPPLELRAGVPEAAQATAEALIANWLDRVIEGAQALRDAGRPRTARDGSRLVAAQPAIGTERRSGPR